MKNLFLVFAVLFAFVAVPLMATETQEVNVEQFKVVADSVASRSIEALDLIESNVDLINDIMDKNVSSVMERLSALTDKFGNKLFTKEKLEEIGKKIEKLSGYAWLGAKEGFKLFTLYVVLFQILSFSIPLILFTISMIVVKKLWKDAIWKEYEWNTSATFTLIASICAIICFTIMMVFFHPTMLAIFVPKVFAAVKLLALVGIYV